MNAVKFVKEYRFDVAKDLAYRDKTSVGYLSVEHHDVCQNDLKRLVEAHELVESIGGLESSIQWLWHPDEIHSKSYADKLEQAIKDVEKCQ